MDAKMKLVNHSEIDPMTKKKTGSNTHWSHIQTGATDLDWVQGFEAK